MATSNAPPELIGGRVLTPTPSASVGKMHVLTFLNGRLRIECLETRDWMALEFIKKMMRAYYIPKVLTQAFFISCIDTAGERMLKNSSRKKNFPIMTTEPLKTLFRFTS
jgi:hypothetical protein